MVLFSNMLSISKIVISFGLNRQYQYQQKTSKNFGPWLVPNSP